jgi:hypothetical protein
MKMNTIERPLSRAHFSRLATVALGGLLLVGCAGNPPNEQFAVTESAVLSAVSAGGTEYAAVEMRAAREKWKQAELAMQQEKLRRSAQTGRTSRVGRSRCRAQGPGSQGEEGRRGCQPGDPGVA